MYLSFEKILLEPSPMQIAVPMILFQNLVVLFVTENYTLCGFCKDNLVEDCHRYLLVNSDFIKPLIY